MSFANTIFKPSQDHRLRYSVLAYRRTLCRGYSQDRFNEAIQRDCRVVIAGPTTLWALLNSLQMGFKTLVIQEKSSEVWRILSAVKTEWTKYGNILDSVQKKLHQASETIEQAKVRSRAVGRKLKDVAELPLSETRVLLPESLLADEEAG